MDSEREDGGQAFPSQPKVWDSGRGSYADTDFIAGMSLRDYFAAKAPDVPPWFERKWVTKVVELGAGMRGPREVQESPDAQLFRWRWYYADAMLKARSA